MKNRRFKKYLKNQSNIFYKKHGVKLDVGYGYPPRYHHRMRVEKESITYVCHKEELSHCENALKTNNRDYAKKWFGTLFSMAEHTLYNYLSTEEKKKNKIEQYIHLCNGEEKWLFFFRKEIETKKREDWDFFFQVEQVRGINYTKAIAITCNIFVSYNGMLAFFCSFYCPVSPLESSFFHFVVVRQLEFIKLSACGIKKKAIDIAIDVFKELHQKHEVVAIDKNRCSDWYKFILDLTK